MMPSVPDAGRRQVEGGRRAEAARAEQQHLGVEQLQLARLAHLGQQEVALVAVALGRGEGLRRRPGAAVVLPLVEAADQRLHVGVAEVAHGLGGEGRAHAAGAVDDDRAGLVGQLALDLELEVAPGQVDGAGDGALLVLVGLPDVEEGDAAALEQGSARRPGPPRGWTPWPRSADLGEWARSNLRVAAGRLVRPASNC